MPSNKYSIKCPYAMAAEEYAVHNTANDASAMAEMSYMMGNNNTTSFHYAIDDYRVVQGIEENRNAYHAGDGSNGRGNRKAIAIEICYSKSGGDRFTKAEDNAAQFIAMNLKEKGWGIDRVKKHQDYSKKYCPHRTLDLGWERFLNKVRAYLGEPVSPVSPSDPLAGKSTDELAREVIAGKYGTGAARKQALGSRYNEVQARVNEILSGKAPTPAPSAPARKTNEQIADEVLAGKWGNGSDRKARITNAGYDYNAIQAIVNKKCGASAPKPTTKSIDEIAREVIAGKWGNGQDRKTRLTNAGYNAAQVQARVNQLLK